MIEQNDENRISIANNAVDIVECEPHCDTLRNSKPSPDGAPRLDFPRLKLVVQIPCWNEEQEIANTVATLPRTIPGIDVIEVMIIDDGSNDRTVAEAIRAGVHYVRRMTHHRGLAAVFMEGLDAALRLKADVLVNTDADNQYDPASIEALIRPILEGRADLVVGNRGSSSSSHRPLIKGLLQVIGSNAVSRLAGVPRLDCTSGFRALNRRAMSRISVHSNYSYTLESVIQAGAAGLGVVGIPICTNQPTRPSRLFRSVGEYLRRVGPSIIFATIAYHPRRVFGIASAFCTIASCMALGRYAWDYYWHSEISRHVQSVTIGVGLLMLSVLLAICGVLGELLSVNRRLLEESLARQRESAAIESLEIFRTDAISWTAESACEHE